SSSGFPSIPYLEFCDRLLSLYQPPLRAPATCDAMRRVLRLLGSVPGVASTADLTTATMARYIALRAATVNPNTLIGELGYLRAACSYAAEEGLLSHPPSWRRLRVRPAEPGHAHPGLAEVAR